MAYHFGKKKQISQALALTLAASMLVATAAGAPRPAEAAVYTGEKDARAGVVGELGEIQADAYASSLRLAESGVIVVAAGEDGETSADATAAAESATEEGTAAVDEWASKVAANVDSQMNVRDSASESGAIVGYLRKGDVADVVSRADGWTQITSGNVTGYVSDQYLVFGDEAHALADSLTPMTATATTDGLRVRSDATTDASALTILNTGNVVTADPSYDTAGGWVKVSVKAGTGYVNAAYVTVARNYTAAITVAEQQEIAAAAAKKAAEEEAAKEAAAKKKAAAQTTANATVQNASVAASADETTLLAGIIYCESGNQPFDGQVAVGDVVLNRMRSSRYPSSMYDVIYQPYQFTPARNGELSRAISSGAYQHCLSAAETALAGTDPTGGALSFKRASSGHAGVVIGAHVFY